MRIDILGLKQQQYSNAIFFNILLHNKYLIKLARFGTYWEI